MTRTRGLEPPPSQGRSPRTALDADPVGDRSEAELPEDGKRRSAALGGRGGMVGETLREPTTEASCSGVSTASAL